MRVVDTFLIWWLKRGRYPWSRFVRKLERIGRDYQPVPRADSLDDIKSILSKVTWTMDNALHLYDSISLPETVWDKKQDDCDGFAVLAARLLKNWKPATNPKLLTVILHPVKESHTVCVFRENEELRFFDNSHLNSKGYKTHEEIVAQLQKRGDRVVCWDLVEPESLRTLQFQKP